MEQVPKKPENLPNDGVDSDKKPFFNRKGIPPMQKICQSRLITVAVIMIRQETRMVILI